MHTSLGFWLEIRKSLMVRGDNWKLVIDSLPSRINSLDALSLFQESDQLTYLTGQGYIAGELVEASPFKGIILPYISDDIEITLENIALQWVYRFLILEGLIEHNRKEPIKKWAPMFLHLTDQGLHFLVYMSAVLVLMEEGQIVGKKISKAKLLSGELDDLVRWRVKKVCELLHEKAQDYGESFRRHGLPGLVPRLWDKIARYAQLKADNRTAKFERMEDSVVDLLGYCCVAWSLMLELPEDFRKEYQPSCTYETEQIGKEWKKL
jgi:hypothetical protein